MTAKPEDTSATVLPEGAVLPEENAVTRPSDGARRGLLRDALRHGRTKIGSAFLVLVLLIVVLGPLFAPYSPTEFVGQPYDSAAPDTVFGTDYLGHDVLTRFLYGGRTMLILALLATIVGVGTGTLLGIIAAYRRGRIDELIMRFGDIALAFPEIVLALLFMSIIGPKMWLLVLLVGFAHMPRVARVVRGAALPVVERDFVKSAEAIGTPRWKIVFAEILPNVTGTLAVEFGLRLTYSIGIVAGLNFLGLGLPEGTADWGLMIDENRIGISVQMWPVLLPVLGIAVLTIGTNLITDGIARASAGIDRTVEK